MFVSLVVSLLVSRGGMPPDPIAMVWEAIGTTLAQPDPRNACGGTNTVFDVVTSSECLSPCYPHHNLVLPNCPFGRKYTAIGTPCGMLGSNCDGDKLGRPHMTLMRLLCLYMQQVHMPRAWLFTGVRSLPCDMTWMLFDPFGKKRIQFSRLVCFLSTS